MIDNLLSHPIAGLLGVNGKTVLVAILDLKKIKNNWRSIYSWLPGIRRYILMPGFKKKYVFNVVHIWPGWVPPPPSVRRTKGHQTSRSTHPDGHNCFLCQKFSHQNTLMVINCFPCQKFSHQNNFPFQNFCHHHLLVEVNASNPPGVLHVSTVGWTINKCTFVQLQLQREYIAYICEYFCVLW